MNDKELITENDAWRIYRTSLTRRMQKGLDSFTEKGVRLGDYYMVFLGEKKGNGDMCYLIFDRKTGRAIDYFQNVREIDLKMWLLESAILDKFDIRNMARR